MWYLSRIVVSVLAFCASSAFAAAYDLPAKGNDLVGSLQKTVVGQRPVIQVMQDYDVGYYELVEANPGVNLDQMSPSQELVVPTEYILPQVPRKGVVVNLAELRLFLYPKGSKQVITYPVGIGKQGRNTPLGRTYVVAKTENPIWHPTPEVRADFIRINGYPLPETVGAGPYNPLGTRAMYLGFHAILMHGSLDPAGIGQRVSAGCIRMFNHDVEALFPLVPKGELVTIVNEPYKAGWNGNTLYFEAHVPVSDYPTPDYKQAINDAIKEKRHVKIIVDWDKAAKLAKLALGVPMPIGQIAN